MRSIDPRADLPSRELLLEIATFLLTYHAYKETPAVLKWKGWMASVLSRCSCCVEGYQRAKLKLEEV